MRNALALAFALAFALGGPARVRGADDAAAGYALVRPSLVKVWAFDAHGRPVESGSGIVIGSDAGRSVVVTAAHVIAGAASVKVDVDRERHDIVAHVQQRGPRDLAILSLDRGGLPPATFAPRSRPVVEGNLIAVAGYVKHDELIGVVGQEPRLLFPGTISSRPDDGAYLELENVHVEEGLSGGPVFDPENGDVLGIVTSRTSDQRGGFADSAALVVEPFLVASAVAFRERGERERIARVVPSPAAATPVAPRTAAPVPKSRTAAPKPAATAAVPLAALAPRPPLALAALPRDLPSPAVPPGPPVWDVRDALPHRVSYVHDGCDVVLALTIAQLAFGASADDARLTLRVARRVAPVAACADVAESNPADGEYHADASSYDGRHVTIRFHYVPGAAATAADAALFPPDVSLDADLQAAPVTAHVTFVDDDWDDVLSVIASRDR